MIAIVKTGGKQYKVREGEILTIEQVSEKEGENLNLEVLLVADLEAGRVQIGTPTVPGATVSAAVVSHGLGRKVSVIKFKPKVRYKRTVGHRQPFTKVKIEKISA